MSTPLKIPLTLLGVTPIDATNDFVSDAIDICFTHDWSFEMGPSGLVGGPGTYTIEVQNGDGNWKAYASAATDVDVNDGLDDDHLNWTMFRVNYTANGTSAGTVSPVLTLKR